MLRLILLAVVALLVVVGAAAVTLFHFYGWKGLIAFPFVVLAIVWLGKFFIGKLIKGFALGLFSMKSKVLRGAAMKVHSVMAVPKPPEPEIEDEEDGEEQEPGEIPATVSDVPQSGVAKQNAHDVDEEAEQPEKPKDYYQIDFTITPGASSQSRVWEPGEFILTSEPVKSLEGLEEKEVGSAHQVLIWGGTEFKPDDECKYPGEQRLQVTFAVNQGTGKAWLQYYNESLGSIDLPPSRAGMSPIEPRPIPAPEQKTP